MAPSDEHLARSFGAAAQTYDAGRPEYPGEAVRWLLGPLGDPRGRRVADVGAGTGKLTRALIELGAEPVAVDPDAAMLRQLRAVLPDVPASVGTAEGLPLPDASMDAVVLGQAWHWVDVPAASREVSRVVRPGGVLGLIWNVRDEAVEWVAELTGITGRSHGEQLMVSGAVVVEHPFRPDGVSEWRWARPMTRADVLAMMASRSGVITADEQDRRRIMTAIEDVCDRIGAVGDRTVDLPYVTRAYRYRRAGAEQ